MQEKRLILYHQEVMELWCRWHVMGSSVSEMPILKVKNISHIELGMYPRQRVGKQDSCRAGHWGPRPWSRGESDGSVAGIPTQVQVQGEPSWEDVHVPGALASHLWPLCGRGWWGCTWSSLIFLDVRFPKPNSPHSIPALALITAFPLCVPLRLSS